MRKLNIIKKISALLIIAIVALIGVRFSFTPRNTTPITQRPLSSTQWNGNLSTVYEIDTIENSSSIMEYVYFSDFIPALNQYKDKDIDTFSVVIEKETDFQYVTMLVNEIPTGLSLPVVQSPTWYLSLNYVLGNDIAFTGQNIYPIGTESTPFTGTFNGQGFVLQNMHIKALEVGEFTTYFMSGIDIELEYYALFSYIGTTGVVKNIIMIDPQASQVETIENAIKYAAPLAGLNQGLIENVAVINQSVTPLYFRINSDAVVSSMVVENTSTGILRNSFCGMYSNSFEGETTGMTLDTYPVIFVDAGTITNVYYDIERFTANVGDINEDITEILQTSSFQTPSLFATDFVNQWFFNNSYSGVSLSSTYPILLGYRLYLDSTDTYKIEDATDLIRFVQLVNQSSVMAGKNFILTRCIDMKAVSENLYQSPTQTFTGVFSSEVADANCLHNHDVSSATTKYHAIWNLSVSKASSGDTTSYAFINQLSGTIQNVNFVNIVQTLSDLATYNANVTYTGSVVGRLLSTGVVSNVNVYGTMSVPNSASSTYGSLYVGGLVGRSSGTITNSSFNGIIVGGEHYNNGNIRTNNAIGGIIGLAEGGTYSNLKNDATIIGMSFKDNSANTNTTNTTYIGGIIGKGTYVSLSQVVNNGLIISHNNATGYIPITYIGGIISVLTDINAITTKTVNNGDIRPLISNVNSIRNYYASGFGTLKTSSTSPISLSNITNSGLVQIAASYTYSGGVYTFNTSFTSHSSLLYTSGGTTVNPAGSTNIGGAIKLTGVIIIDTQTAANLEGIFQDADQTIDLGILYRYAPVIYSLNESSSYVINVEKAINTGTLSFVTTRSMYNPKVQLTGNTYGDYINFNQARNEGDINIDITYASVNTFKLSGTLTDYSSNLRISGLVGTINSGYHIYNSYNGGNITIKNYTNSTKTTLLSSTTVGVKTSTLQYMLYIGGIAFKNANTTDIEPVANVIIASSRKGGIHNVLND
ncbi:MAG: hypothetical protein PHY42_03425, partial [Bacilli bacterium]|nr:hypothetical protein [Bacilli bacterium]